MLENAGLAVSHRSLQYDMGRLYPGLQLRIGPTMNGGMLEFIVDPESQYDERSHLVHEESTGNKIFLIMTYFINYHGSLEKIHSSKIRTNQVTMSLLI